MTPLRIAIAAVVGTAIGASSAAPGTPPASVAPTATAVVVQAPACPAPRVSIDLDPAEARRRSAPEAALPAAARRLAAQGADVTVVCDAAAATAAVVRAAAGHDAVLGSGPDVRAALSLAAADHPAQRFGPLPAR